MLLRVEALALLTLAGVLATVAPRALARASWPARAPRAALVLWQAIGLTGGLSLLATGITAAAADIGPSWPAAVAVLVRHRSRLATVGWIGVIATALVGAWLIVVLLASTGRILLARREHRRRLDLVTEPAQRLGGAQLLSHPLAVAYCVPGLRPRIVLSSGALTLLDSDQLEAVLCHERAHARGRHDLVVQPFVAWRNTFPFLRAATSALAAVELLVEMLADDVARRRSGDAVLLTALRGLAGSGRIDDEQLRARGARLTGGRRLAGWQQALVYAAAALLVLLPPLALLAS